MPKTIILAIATLILAVAALVTDLVSPYAGGIDNAASAGSPIQVEIPARSPARVPVRVEVRALASKTPHLAQTFDAI